MLKLPEGQEIGLGRADRPWCWTEPKPAAYVDTHAGVRALDMGTVRWSRPLASAVTPLSRSEPGPRLHRGGGGVTIFDRSGRVGGEAGFDVPRGGRPRPECYAYAAVVNPVSGYVGVVLNNGIPGSNNGSFLRIYPPESDKPIETDSPHSFVQDLTTDRDGNWYVAYGPARGQEGIHVLRSSGQTIRRLDGRSGEMVLDEAAGRLYLLLYGSVTSLSLQLLTPMQFYAGPDPVQSVAFSPKPAHVVRHPGQRPACRVHCAGCAAGDRHAAAVRRTGSRSGQ